MTKENKKFLAGVIVYAETPNGSYAEQIAYFSREEDYDVCMGALMEKYEKDRMIITESCNELFEGDEMANLVVINHRVGGMSKEIDEMDDPCPLKAMEDGINDAIGVGEMSSYHPNLKIYKRAFDVTTEALKEC